MKAIPGIVLVPMKYKSALVSFLSIFILAVTVAGARPAAASGDELVLVYCKAEIQSAEGALLGWVTADLVFSPWNSSRPVLIRQGELSGKRYTFEIPDEPLQHHEGYERIRVRVGRFSETDTDGDLSWSPVLEVNDPTSNFRVQFVRNDIRAGAVETISCQAYTD